MGPDTPQSAVDTVDDTITEAVFRPGSPERNAVNQAYSDIFRYMSIAALVASARPLLILLVPTKLEAE